jgi:hypothetical protein
MPESSEAARPAETDSNRVDPVRVVDPPLDLVHLARQSLGDRELEDELLMLFRQQLQMLTAQLSDPALLSLDSKAKIAHRLRGSALALGARRVACAARVIEELACCACERPRHNDTEGAAEGRAIAVLLAAVTEVVAEIQRIRG